jgi:EmrB/QacA subfamily drug resistance transporter
VKQLTSGIVRSVEQRESSPAVVLAIVCVGVVLATLDLFIVNVAFPSITRGFHGVSLSTLSWVLNAYAIVVAALLVPAGRLADRHSRKGGFLLGIAIFVAGSALCAASPDVAFLIGARVVQAAGAALMIPSSLGLLLAAYPPQGRMRAVRIYAAMSGVAAALGPVVGGLLVSASWRWIFLVNLPVGVAALVVGRRHLPALPRVSEPRPDLFGAGMLAVAAGGLTLALVQAPVWGWASAGTIGCLVGAAVVFAIFLWRSSRHPSPVVEIGLLRSRAFSASVGAMFVFSGAFAAMLFSVVVFAQTVWGWSALKTGLAFAPGPLMVPVWAIAAGRFSHRIAPGVLAALGGTIYAGGAIWWATAVGLEANWATGMLPGALLTGTGVGLTLPTWTAAAAAAVPRERFATGSAVINMARQLGYTIGVAILVAVLGSPVTQVGRLHAYRHGWEVIAGLALLSSLASLVLVERRREAAGAAVIATPVSGREP